MQSIYTGTKINYSIVSVNSMLSTQRVGEKVYSGTRVEQVIIE
jgi:hypothetical protein